LSVKPKVFTLKARFEAKILSDEAILLPAQGRAPGRFGCRPGHAAAGRHTVKCDYFRAGCSQKSTVLANQTQAGASGANGMVFISYDIANAQLNIMKNAAHTTALKSVDLMLRSILKNDLQNYRTAKSQRKNTEGKQLIAA
jgi:hypothetical protein